ncbi:hypothetical protein IMSAGC003_01925 [Lachnospiraceae bacterium]|nr:hypothetical protein IMSAGC003_01925 [Lachnospiraceae bacterium]
MTITPAVMGILLETMATGTEMATPLVIMEMAVLLATMGMATVKIRTTGTVATVLPTTEKEETGKTTGM